MSYDKRGRPPSENCEYPLRIHLKDGPHRFCAAREAFGLALAIQPGAARFRSTGCATRIDDNETPSCDVSLTAGVEQCGG